MKIPCWSLGGRLPWALFLAVAAAVYGLFPGAGALASESDPLYALLQRSRDTQDAERILSRQFDRYRKVDAYAAKLSAQEWASLNLFAVSALFRQSLVGSAWKAVDRFPEGEAFQEPKERLLPFAASAELSKVYRELRRTHWANKAAAVAMVGSTLLAAGGGVAMTLAQPEQTQAWSALGWSVGAPLALLASYFSYDSWAENWNLKRHRLWLVSAARAFDVLVGTATLIDVHLAQQINLTVAEIARRSHPFYVENRHVRYHARGTSLKPQKLGDVFFDFWNSYRCFLEGARFQTGVVRDLIQRGSNQAHDLLAEGLKLPAAQDYHPKTRQRLHAAIRLFEADFSPSEWVDSAISELSDSEMGPSEYYASANEPLPVEPSVYAVKRDSKPGEPDGPKKNYQGVGVFEATFRWWDIHGKETQPYFVLAPEHFHDFARDLRQSVFYSAMEKAMPASRGTWLRYRGIGDSQYVYIDAENFPASVPLSVTGPVEMWTRPWQDREPYATFSPSETRPTATRAELLEAWKLGGNESSCAQALLPVSVREPSFY